MECVHKFKKVAHAKARYCTECGKVQAYGTAHSWIEGADDVIRFDSPIHFDELRQTNVNTWQRWPADYLPHTERTFSYNRIQQQDTTQTTWDAADISWNTWLNHQNFLIEPLRITQPQQSDPDQSFWDRLPQRIPRPNFGRRPAPWHIR
jgi:hypothetical protein